MSPTARFINGVFRFEGKGYDKPSLLDVSTGYLVPGDKRAQLIYLRAGNSADQLIYLVLTRNGKPLRYFPLGAKSSVHVSLAIVEDIFPESQLEVHVGAPGGASGVVVLDLGLVEVD
jgi:hypothetical protein